MRHNHRGSAGPDCLLNYADYEPDRCYAPGQRDAATADQWAVHKAHNHALWGVLAWATGDDVPVLSSGAIVRVPNTAGHLGVAIGGPSLAIALWRGHVLRAEA